MGLSVGVIRGLSCVMGLSMGTFRQSSIVTLLLTHLVPNERRKSGFQEAAAYMSSAWNSTNGPRLKVHENGPVFTPLVKLIGVSMVVPALCMKLWQFHTPSMQPKNLRRTPNRLCWSHTRQGDEGFSAALRCTHPVPATPAPSSHPEPLAISSQCEVVLNM